MPEDRELVVGHVYQAIGPKPGSKLGPPQRVTVVGVSERGYVIEGARLVAPIILFGCEHFWTPVTAELLDPPAAPPAPARAAPRVERVDLWEGMVLA